MTRRNEYFIREDILKCYSELSPESIYNTNLNKTQIRAKISKTNKELKYLFKEYGRVVSQEEALGWLRKKVCTG